MGSKVAAAFDRVLDAEAAKARLIAVGVEPDAIRIAQEEAEEAPAAGMFDQLTSFLAPRQASAASPYLLTAEVPPELLEAATRAVDIQEFRPLPASNELRESTIELVEKAEELVIEKELFVREELVLKRTAVEHVQEVTEVVRRTEAEVERIEPSPAR